MRMRRSRKRQRSKRTAMPLQLKSLLVGWVVISCSSSNFAEARTHDTVVDDVPSGTSKQSLIRQSENMADMMDESMDGGQATTFSFQNSIDAAYDLASIDQDLKQIGQLLRNGNFEEAKRLYEDGSHSASYAHIVLEEPLQEVLPAGSIVTGPAHGDDSTIVTGLVQDTVRPGERELKIRYIFDHTNVNARGGSASSLSEVAGGRPGRGGASKQSLIQSRVPHFSENSEKSKRHRDDRENQARGYSQAVVVNKDHFCYVGGNPEPVTDGCFKTSGTLTVDAFGRDYAYRYDILNDNRNDRTISNLSQEIEPSAPQYLSKEFSRFSTYFGRFDYADHLIQTAFRSVSDPTATTDMERSNLHFYHFNDDGLASFVHTLMAHMTIWMEMVVNLDAAIEICPAARNEALQHWDDAVALYIGSRGTRGSILQFDLAAKQCQVFRTCPPDSTEVRVSTFSYQEGEVHINQEIADALDLGGQLLMEGDCDAVKSRKAKIVRLMTIPLIQATLLESYKVSNYGEDNYIMGPDASAIAYAMSILPLIHACSEEDASTLADALGDLHTPASFWSSAASANTSSKKPLSFAIVKQTLEKNYSCLKIKCSDVGGIWNFNTNSYMEGAEPCDGTASFSENDEDDDDFTLSVNASNAAMQSGEQSDEAGFLIFIVIVVVAGAVVLGLTVYRFVEERRDMKRRIEEEIQDNRNLHAFGAKRYCDDSDIEITLD